MMHAHAPARDPSIALATTLANRMCHDIAGLLGTLAGTLEMAAEDPEAASLASETAETLKHRIRLLRAAWGGDEGPLSAGALVDLARGLPNSERLRLDVSAITGELPAAEAQLTLCLLLAAPHLRAGVIHIATSARGVRVTLPVPWPASLVSCAANVDAAWAGTGTARDLPAPLACLLATTTGHRISVDGTTAEIQGSDPNR
jgi:histidine phosphotransferase ChpT